MSAERTTCSPGTNQARLLNFQSFGSVVSHEYGSQKSFLLMFAFPMCPMSCRVGTVSSSYGPFGLGSDPAQGTKVRDLSLPKEISNDRFSKRRSLLDTVDDHFHEAEK